MPVVRGLAVENGSHTFLGSVRSPFAAFEQLADSAIASVLILASSGTLMLVALRISVKRIRHHTRRQLR